MSTCISRHGEFGSHTHTTDPLTCDLCHVLDEDGARQRIAELEAQVSTLTAREVDGMVERILREHLLTGPRPGQCLCGHGDENLPVRELGQPHARHVVRALRAAGVMKGCGEPTRHGDDPVGLPG